MKLGILTFHSAHNYGAVLQAYGLQEYLKASGHDVYIIDYRPWYITNKYLRNNSRDWLSKNPMMCAKRLYHYVVHKSIRYKRYDGFEHFISERMNLYPFQKGMDLHEFDAIITGSDQVWNPAQTNGKFDEIYFGCGFVCPSIAYAPSSTHLHLSDNEKLFLSGHLDSLSAISVREPGLAHLMQPFTKQNVFVTLDPSLLAGRTFYDKLATQVNTPRPYIVTYEIGCHHEVYSVAKDLARSMGADLIELVNGMQSFHRKTMKEAASPEEFLGYIKHASCVITTSFHGTAFSILFGTPFYTVMQGNAADGRMMSLLSQLGLEDRMIGLNEKPDLRPLDTIELGKRLKKITSKSRAFLSDALHDICRQNTF